MTRSRKIIAVHPLFVEKIKGFERAMENKYDDKWSDPKVTKYIAENLDWENFFNPLGDSKFSKKKSKSNNFDFRIMK